MPQGGRWAACTGGLCVTGKQQNHVQLATCRRASRARSTPPQQHCRVTTLRCRTFPPAACRTSLSPLFTRPPYYVPGHIPRVTLKLGVSIKTA